MSGMASGLDRAAQAMLRTLGAGSAWLLLPQMAADSAQSGLGLAAPLTYEVELNPVLLRSAGTQSAQSRPKLYAVATRCTLQKALSGAGATSGDASSNKQTLAASALRVDEIDYRIVSVNVKWISGMELLYELEIEE